MPLFSHPDHIDEEYNARGHGPGEMPPDWPGDQEWPPRGTWPHPLPGVDHDAKARQAELTQELKTNG